MLLIPKWQWKYNCENKFQLHILYIQYIEIKGSENTLGVVRNEKVGVATYLIGLSNENSNPTQP